MRHPWAYFVLISALIPIHIGQSLVAAITSLIDSSGLDSAHISARSPQDEFHTPSPHHFPPPDLEFPTYQPVAVAEDRPKKVTVIRCKAREGSAGNVLASLVVLSIGCVVHMPGSVAFLNYKGFYRLAPELGLLEAYQLILLVVSGTWRYKKSFRLSAKAALALRHALGQGDSWWLQDSEVWSGPYRSRELLTAPSITSAESYDRLAPFLGKLRRFSHARFLALIITIFAFIKACFITGSIRTTVLAASYFISFAVIELLSWSAVEPGPPSSKTELESEAVQITHLMIVLDPFWHDVGLRYTQYNLSQRYSEVAQTEGTAFVLFSQKIFITKFMEPGIKLAMINIFLGAVAVFTAAATIVQIFWPISVPLFLLYDFGIVQTGKWTFVYLNSFLWLLCISAAGLITLAGAHGLAKLFNKDTSVLLKRAVPKNLRRTNILLAAYVTLKVVLILRFCITQYTGLNTRKPGWVDWLG